MAESFEEEPEPAPEEPEETPAAEAPSIIPTVDAKSSEGRDFAYRTELLTSEKLTDGKALAELLTKTSAEGWDLVEIISAGQRHVVLLRKPNRESHQSRRVGFTLSHHG
jgi:hypothetical protein